jgi:hypothetical protein
MKQIILLLFVVIIISCSNKKASFLEVVSTSDVPLDVYDTKPQSENIVRLSSISDKIEYIPLEMKDDVIIGSIDKIEVKDSLFYILDKKAQIIWCFDCAGKYKFKISRRGQGPGEYVKIYDFNIDHKNNSILILDRDIRKILYYDMNGKYINDLRLEVSPSKFSLLENKMLFYTRGVDLLMKNGNSDLGYNLFLTDKEGSILSKYFPYNESTDKLMGNNVLDNYEDRAIISYAMNDTIYEFDKNGNMINKLLFDFGKYRIPVEKINDSQMQLDYMNNPSYAKISDVFYSDRFMYATYAYGMRIRFILLDNKEKKLINGSLIENDIDFVSLLNPTPIKIIGNKALFIKEADAIFNQEKNNKKIYENIEQLSSLKEDDNPVIVVVHLNIK